MTGAHDSLLPGEDDAVRSGRRDDARLWCSVYEELTGFKETLLETVWRQREKAQAESRAEINNDERVLREEAARLQRRLEFWREETKRRS